MAEFVVYLRVQPTVEDKLAMDEAFGSSSRVIYVTDGVKPDITPPFTVEYNGLVGETSGRRYVTLHYESHNVVIRAAFSGLGMAVLAFDIGNRTVDELVDKSDYSPDKIMYLYRSPFYPPPPIKHH